MAINKITESDLENKGVVGQAEVPGIPAAEMQYKVEEIVRAVAIPKINEVVDEFENVDGKMALLEETVDNKVSEVTKGFVELSEEVGAQVGEVKRQISGFDAEIKNIPNTYATKDSVEQIILNGGQAVTSVFGRVGAIVAQSGDYTPELVGAAPKSHKHYKSDIQDFPASLPASDVYSWAKASEKPNYTAEEIGAEEFGAVSSHNMNSGAHSALFAKKADVATAVSASGAITVTLQDNCEYTYTGVSSLNMNGTNGEAHGFITFGNSVGAINVSGNNAGDDISKAKANESWEFSCFKNRFIWKNWG